MACCAGAAPRAVTQLALDELLVTASADDETDAEAAESRRSILNELKADAGAISLESVLTEIAKLERLRGLGLPDGLFDDVSLRVVERFRQRAAPEAPNELRAHATPPTIRHSLHPRRRAGRSRTGPGPLSLRIPASVAAVPRRAGGPGLDEVPY
jgi:hypothetical protein